MFIKQIKSIKFNQRIRIFENIKKFNTIMALFRVTIIILFYFIFNHKLIIKIRTNKITSCNGINDLN